MPYVYVDECPICRCAPVRVHFGVSDGLVVNDVACDSCGAILDDFEEIIAACEGEVEFERGGDL
jgi:hypothetical protein